MSFINNGGGKGGEGKPPPQGQGFWFGAEGQSDFGSPPRHKKKVVQLTHENLALRKDLEKERELRERAEKETEAWRKWAETEQHHRHVETLHGQATDMEALVNAKKGMLADTLKAKQMRAHWDNAAAGTEPVSAIPPPQGEGNNHGPQANIESVTIDDDSLPDIDALAKKQGDYQSFFHLHQLMGENQSLEGDVRHLQKELKMERERRERAEKLVEEQLRHRHVENLHGQATDLASVAASVASVTEAIMNGKRGMLADTIKASGAATPMPAIIPPPQEGNNHGRYTEEGAALIRGPSKIDDQQDADDSSCRW